MAAAAPPAKMFTLADLKAHATEGDCHILVHGKVYDVTEFLDEHPGGFDIIVSNTGEEAWGVWCGGRGAGARRIAAVVAEQPPGRASRRGAGLPRSHLHRRAGREGRARVGDRARCAPGRRAPAPARPPPSTARRGHCSPPGPVAEGGTPAVAPPPTARRPPPPSRTQARTRRKILTRSGILTRPRSSWPSTTSGSLRSEGVGGGRGGGEGEDATARAAARLLRPPPTALPAHHQGGDLSAAKKTTSAAAVRAKAAAGGGGGPPAALKFVLPLIALALAFLLPKLLAAKQ